MLVSRNGNIFKRGLINEEKDIGYALCGGSRL